MGRRARCLVATFFVAVTGRASAASVVFHPPTLVQSSNDPHDPASGGMGLFYALDDTHLFGQADVVAYLIKVGADTTILDKNKDSAMHWAAYKGA